jgi:LPXTG-motif cell wall-anchored protein
VDTGSSGSVTFGFTPRFGAPGKVTATGKRIGPLSLLRWNAELGSEQDVTSISGPVDAAPDADTWVVVKPSLVTIVKQDAESGAVVPGAVIGFSDTASGAPFAQVTTKATPVAVPGLDNRAGQRVYYRELASPTGYLADGAAGSFVVGQDGGTIALVMKDSAASPSCSSHASASEATGSVVFGVAGGPVGDSVTCDGLPPNNPSFEVAEDLLHIALPPTGRCSDATAAAWTAGNRVASAVIAMPATPDTGSGPYSVTGTVTPALTIPATVTTDCLAWRGTTAPWPGAATIELEPVPAEQVTLVHAQLATRVQQQTVQPGGLVVDLVEVTGIPTGLTGPFPATADVRSLPVGPHGCAGLGPAQFARVRPYRSVPFRIDHGNGTYQIRISAPREQDRCLNFTERFTQPLWPSGPTPSAQVGEAAETTLVDHPPTRTPVTASGGGGGRGHGLPYTGADPAAALVIGGAAVGVGGLLLLGGRRRQEPVPADS